MKGSVHTPYYSTSVTYLPHEILGYSTNPVFMRSVAFYEVPAVSREPHPRKHRKTAILKAFAAFRLLLECAKCDILWHVLPHVGHSISNLETLAILEIKKRDDRSRPHKGRKDEKMGIYESPKASNRNVEIMSNNVE